MQEIECKEVIVSNLTRRGKGVQDDPTRIVTQVFEKDGRLIAEYDPHPCTSFTENDMIRFGMWCFERSIQIVNQDTIRQWREETTKVV